MRILCIGMVFLVASAFAAGINPGSWQSLGGQADSRTQVTVVESDFSHLVVDIDVPGFWLTGFPANGQTWDRLDLPGHWAQGEIGLAELPSVANLFALPYGTEPVLTIEDVQYTVFSGLSVFPRQIPAVDMPQAPYGFRFNSDIYFEDTACPSTWATVDNDGIWSGLRVARLLVNPLRFNGATGELMAVNSIRLRIDFTGTIDNDAGQVSPAIMGGMCDQVINWNTFRNSATPVDGLDAGTEYLFIVNSTTFPAVEELINSHHALGLQSKVITLSNPSTTSAIKTAVMDNYETGITRFVLIAGDNTAMPGYTGYSGVSLSDYYFAMITADNYPDLAVGRLTGDAAQIQHQVDKILDGYVNYGFSDEYTTGIIPSTAVLAAHQQDYPGKYTLCCNQIAAYVYDLIDMTFYKIFPPEGGTNTMVSDWINDGIGSVGYRGHGDVTIWSWAAPGSWTVAMTNALTNTFMPPVFNIACYCGQFATAGTCLCEAWQWATNGASGNNGAYNPSYTEANHEYMKKIYIALYDTGLFRVQEAINTGCVYIIDNFGTYGLTNARMYFWFGDPAMEIWTFDTASEPIILNIDAPYSVPSGSQTINVTVNDGASAVEGVDVTLTDGIEGTATAMTFYETETTNASGEVSFTVTVPPTGTLMVGAHKHDHMPDIDEIIIGVGIGDQTGSALPSAFSLATPVPNPVALTAAVSFSLPSSGTAELAVFDVTGRKVDTLIDGEVTAGIHSASWQPGSQIANGVYFIRLSTSEGTITRQAMVVR